MSERRNWERPELILAFNLYAQIPFGTIHTGNPKIQELAQLLGRTAGAVSYKLANIASLDPALKSRGINGLAHGSKAEKALWDEFEHRPEELVFESQQVLADFRGVTLEETLDPEFEHPIGRDRETSVKQRVNQQYFRRRVLSLYRNTCCVTGLAIKPLLTASHIIPWSVDERNRLNPRNGLCLNALHDRAFDCGLMWIDSEFRVQFKESLLATTPSKETTWLTGFQGKPLLLPDRFSPDMEKLQWHAQFWRDRDSSRQAER